MKTTDPTGAAAHGRALEILNAKQQPLTRENYIAAMNEAQRRLEPEVQQALDELGLAPAEPGAIVTEGLLQQRALEILRESRPADSDAPSERELVDAYKQAIRELGAPGEPRTDSQPLKGSSAGRRADLDVLRRQLEGIARLLDEAVAEGAIEESAVESIRATAKKEPEVALVALTSALRGRREAKAAFRSEQVEPDNESFDLHSRAEEIIVAKGWGEQTPHGLVYDGPAYMRALRAAQKEQAKARDADEGSLTTSGRPIAQSE